MRFGCAFLGWLLLAVSGMIPATRPVLGLLGIGYLVVSVVMAYHEARRAASLAPKEVPQVPKVEPQPQQAIAWKYLYCPYLEWEGNRVRSKGRSADGVFRGETQDTELGERLGWVFHDGVYTGNIPAGVAVDTVNESWRGEVDGATVFIMAESDDHYLVLAFGGKVIGNWKLRCVDKGEWEGPVPKVAFTRVWAETRRSALGVSR